MTETQATSKLLSHLKREGFFWKASEKYTAGIPDIIGCYLGRFVAIEMKIDYNKPTPIQIHTLSEVTKNTGYSAVITFSNKKRLWRLGLTGEEFKLADLVTQLKVEMKDGEGNV